MVTINKNNKFKFSLTLLLTMSILGLSPLVYGIEATSSTTAASGSGPAVSVSVNTSNNANGVACVANTSFTIWTSCGVASGAISGLVGKTVDLAAHTVGTAAVVTGSFAQGIGLGVISIGEGTSSFLKRWSKTTTFFTISAAMAGAAYLYARSNRS
jgi:hypothetical protein